MYCNVIAIIVIFSSSITLHNYLFFLVGIIKFQSLNKFAGCSTVLLSNYYIVHWISMANLLLVRCKWSYPPNNSDLIPPPAYPTLFFMSLSSLDFTYNQYLRVLIFLCPISLSTMCLRSIHIVTNGKLSFFMAE